MTSLKGIRMSDTVVLASLILGLLLLPAPTYASDSDTTIQVVPARVDVSAGEEFSVEIVIDPDGVEVYSGQYTLGFDPEILEALSQVEGDLLNEAGTVNTIEVTNNIDNEAGKLEYGLTRMGVTTGVTTTGTLSRITFRVTGADRGSNLELIDVVVGDTMAEPIPVTVESGVCPVDGNAPASTPTPTATTAEVDTHASTVTGTVAATATATTTVTTTATPEAEQEHEAISGSGEPATHVSTSTAKEMKSMPVSTPEEATPGFSAIMACTCILIIPYALKRRFG